MGGDGEVTEKGGSGTGESAERTEPSIPPQSGPFYSNYGPRDGPILYGKAPIMGVLDGRGNVVGIAWLGGAIPSRRGPVHLWELEVGKHRLEGRWICRCREFIRLGDAAEENAHIR